MFVVLFMVIVAVELVCKAMHEKLECGHYKKTDVEDVDPAALVGTFKRYKWNKIAAGKLIAIIFSGGESTSKCAVKLFHFKENWSQVYEIIDRIFIRLLLGLIFYMNKIFIIDSFNLYTGTITYTNNIFILLWEVP